MQGNMKNMMKKMQKMQKEMGEAQQQLEAKEYTGVANDDLVKVTMNGKRDVLNVDITEDIAESGDAEMLEDLVLIAVKDVLSQVDKDSEEVMGKYTKNLNIPGM